MATKVPIAACNVVQEDSLNLPELSEHHLLTVFFASGISHGQVNSLGILLGLKRDQLACIRSKDLSTHPDWYAMMTVKKWLDMECLSPEQAYETLEEQLRLLELNSIIPRLYGQQRNNTVDPDEIRRFLSVQTRHFSKNQAKIFGHYLGLSNDKIRDIASEMEARRGADIVLHLFDQVDRQSTSLREPLIDRIITAFLKATSMDDDYQDLQVSTPSRSSTKSISSQCGLIYSNGYHHEVETDGSALERGKSVGKPSKPLQKYKGHWRKIVFKVITTIAVLLSILAILCLSFLPVIQQNFPSQTAVPYDVILYHFPIDTYWLDSVKLQILGPDGGCYVEVMSVQCNKVQLMNKTTRETSDTNYLYLEKGSTMKFALDDDTDCEYCVPYYVWVFTSIIEARANAIDNFNNLACSKPPHNVWCIEVTKSNVFIAPVSSYYFIRCDRDPNCTLLETIQINTTNYDFRSTNVSKIDRVRVKVGQGKKLLNLKPRPFYPSFDEICLLLKFREVCGMLPVVYHINVQPTRRHDLLLYPFLLLTVVLIVCASFYVFICYKKFKH